MEDFEFVPITLVLYLLVSYSGDKRFLDLFNLIYKVLTVRRPQMTTIVKMS